MSAARTLISVGALVAALSVGACASSVTTRYYTLMPSPTAVEGAAGQAAYAIEVMPVGVPEQVDVPQLIVRSGGGELSVVDTRHWAAPLGREFRAALSERLSRSLGARDVYRLERDASQPLWRIKVNVQRFDSELGRQASLDAVWSVADGKVVLNCTTQIRESVGGSYDALVAGHQRAAARLADDIAGALRQLAAGTATGCPA